jgi:chromate transporter
LIDPFLLFWLLLKASLLSSGGMGNVSILHADLLSRGWSSDQQFAEALAIGQITPGPNGLWVISLGYLVRGVSGGVLAGAAISLPPILVLGVARLYRRVKDHPAVEGFMRGLSLAGAGIFVVVLASLYRGVHPDTHTAAIAAASFALASVKRISPLLILALAAIAGMLWR